jgi:hypothetical protein
VAQGISLLEREIAQGSENVDNLRSQVTTAWCTIAELFMTDLWYVWLTVHVWQRGIVSLVSVFLLNSAPVAGTDLEFSLGILAF